MSYLEYVKAQGFSEKVSEEALAAHANIVAGRELIQKSLAALKDAVQAGESDFPGFQHLLGLIHGVQATCTAQTDFAFLWSVQTTAALQERVRALEAKSAT